MFLAKKREITVLFVESSWFVTIMASIVHSIHFKIILLSGTLPGGKRVGADDSKSIFTEDLPLQNRFNRNVNSNAVCCELSLEGNRALLTNR